MLLNSIKGVLMSMPQHVGTSCSQLVPHQLGDSMAICFWVILANSRGLFSANIPWNLMPFGLQLELCSISKTVFLLLKIPNIFWDIKHIMKTQAKVCTFWLWKFVTRERSTKKRTETLYWYSICWKSITAWMKHVQIKASVNKLPRQKVSFWTFRTVSLI